MSAATIPGRSSSTGGTAGTLPTGRVHSWDISTGVDGPGTRFVLFLAGCPLRCRYCHNPETWTAAAATEMDVDEVMDEVLGYERFLQVAGGGVTLSGGEPLGQAAFCEAIARRCQERGLHTALDTSGNPGHQASEALLDAIDLVLLDLKSIDADTYRYVTGGEIGPTLAFAERLANRDQRTWVRFVLVPGLTDAPANVAGLAAHVAALGNVERVEVIPFHRMGAAKYAALGIPYPCGDVDPPGEPVLERVRAQFAAQGLHVT
jgi:pyruvate formate lyase activating enzyme